MSGRNPLPIPVGAWEKLFRKQTCQKEGSSVADLGGVPWVWGLHSLAAVAGRHFLSHGGQRRHQVRHSLSLQCATTSKCLSRRSGEWMQMPAVYGCHCIHNQSDAERGAMTASEISRLLPTQLGCLLSPKDLLRQ